MLTPIFEPSMNYMRLAFAWIELICYVAIVAATVLRFRKNPLEATRRNVTPLVVCCVLYALTYVPITPDPLSAFAQIVFIFHDWIKLVLLTIILTNAVRLLSSRKKNRTNE